MPGEISCNSSMARARAADRVRRILRLFETHAEASVRSLIAEDVLRIDDAWKLALSSTMRVVVSPMALPLPPITPASAMAPAASAITRLEGSSVYCFVIERDELLAGLRGADEDRVALQQVGIEGVHGLRQFRHHEIRHVDDVVDRV